MNLFNQTSLHNDSQLDIVKQKFTINVTLLGTSLMLVYIAIYINIEAKLSAITCIFALTVLVPGIFILIAKNKIYFARLLCVVTTVLVVAISSIGLRNLANVEYYFLQSMMLSLLLFESHQKKSLAFTLFLPIFAWICTKVVLPYYEFNTWLISTNFKYFEYLAVFNFIGAFFLTYMFLKFYSNSMYKSKNIEIKNEHNLMQTSKMVSLGQLASGIAHEINNPLSIIIGRTQLLKNKLDQHNETNFDPNFYQQSLGKIENTAALIAKIVKGLNAFSRNSDHDPMQSQSIVKIINSALDLCIERLNQEKIKIQISYQQDMFFHCREVQIIQILVNLISNSIDAIEKLEERWIIIDSTHDKNWIYVSVSDSGLGINTKIREKIMLPFFSTKEVGKGIGLGLSISNSIAETHQGSLCYDTKSAHTKFTLKLPLNLRPN